MMAISARLFTSNAIDMHECGKLCTKFIVPSTGSMIHVGLSHNTAFVPSLVVSSPMKLKTKIVVMFESLSGRWLHQRWNIQTLTNDAEMRPTVN